MDGIIKVSGPDGQIYGFPAGTSEEQMAQAMMSVYPAQQNEPPIPQPQSYSDVSPPPMGWGDVASQAVDNIPASAKQFGQDMMQPIMHPIDTAKAVGNVALGAAQKLIPGEQEAEASADAVGKFFADRYGGLENVKRTIANDPVGFMADLSTVLTGGGAAVARAPGVVGKAANVASKAGAAVDPLTLAGKGVSKVASGLGKGASEVTGLMSGVGSAPVEEAYKAGRAGGDAAEAFTKNMRGGASEMMGILDDAKLGLQKMRQARSEAYRSGMVDVSKDATVLDYNQVRKALDDAIEANTFNGVAKSRGTAKVLDEVRAEIDAWGELDPSVYHTPEGLDALKQRVSDLVDWKNRGDKENLAAQSMTSAIKGMIEQQAPGYAKTMRDYSEATEQLSEIKKALSLGDKASADTALRKLTSVMRNNVNTNFGQRAEALNTLETASGKPLVPAIAGQSMNSVMPQGLSRLTAGLTAAGGYVDPTLLALLPAQSPRIVGEGAYAMGKAARPVGRFAQMLGPDFIRNLALENWQAGRIGNQEEERLGKYARQLMQ